MGWIDDVLRIRSRHADARLQHLAAPPPARGERETARGGHVAGVARLWRRPEPCLEGTSVSGRAGVESVSSAVAVLSTAAAQGEELLRQCLDSRLHGRGVA